MALFCCSPPSALLASLSTILAHALRSTMDSMKDAKRALYSCCVLWDNVYSATMKDGLEVQTNAVHFRIQDITRTSQLCRHPPSFHYILLHMYRVRTLLKERKWKERGSVWHHNRESSFHADWTKDATTWLACLCLSPACAYLPCWPSFCLFASAAALAFASLASLASSALA